MSNAPSSPLRIGTRGSPLALAQAYEVQRLLRAAWPELAPDTATEVVVIDTRGDRILDRALAEIGGKGLFTEEIEARLHDGRIDVAVHSMKDMPTELPDGLEIPCMLPREDPRDVLLSRDGLRLDQLAAGAVVGTASLRRKSQVLAQRPDLKVIVFRGNVQTRMRKLKEGQADATLLALAGLNRLDIADVATQVFEPEELLPAVAQGAIGVEIRSADDRVRKFVAAISCADTVTCVNAERAMLHALDGSCRTPIAGQAHLKDGQIVMDGLVASEDGAQVWRDTDKGPASDGAEIGRRLGMRLKVASGRAPIS
ncbi:MAG: hydroxymethylbilane synthase [Myxococcales bacterium]|nr:hydroxymethylbilane synthase [Myxococcales bacterium]